MSDSALTPFNPGDVVRRKSSPEMVGRVIETFWDPQVESWDVRVQFGTRTVGASAADLEPFSPCLTPWEELSAGKVSGAGHFRDLVTFERLRRPPARIADSFGTARAQLLPYQFVPLLKFLDSPIRRLLIADDVGLGKTIEAGYVLRELRRHRDLERVLIVVPARLRTKWKTELRRRFAEDFEIVGRPELSEFVKGLRRGRPKEDFRWITSYESARARHVIDALEEFEPSVDLLIFDEAHRLRNPGTLQNRLGRVLAGCAEALLFLTATPIQTSIENLFQLFRLLDPEHFDDFSTFVEQMEANRPVIRALGALRGTGAERNTAAEHLRQLRQNRMTSELAKGEFFASLLARAERASDLERRELVVLQQDIGELSLTGSLVSRTRKRDVLKNRPRREAQSPLIEPNADERAVFDMLESDCKDAARHGGGWGAAMAALMSYRLTTSCLPAALEAFQAQLAERLDGETFAAKETESENGWLERSEDREDGPAASETRGLEEAVDRIAVLGVDSKFRAFERVLQTIWEADQSARRADRKIVVFSFFKRTLRYLSRRLGQAGVGHRVIDGDVPIPEREARIEDFSTEPGIKVLLSSEVGGEGLDLQFASVVINYDLPWNPMVLEQRIGRIDRIGQKSPTIAIVNLVYRGTVEDRILNRLYARIGLFEETIGEIDPILGQRVQDLAIEILLGRLSPEEESEQVAQAETAIETSLEQARRLAEDADGLLAADQAFLDEVDALLGRRRIPTREEVHAYLSHYLELTYLGASVPKDTLGDVAEVRIPVEVASRAADELVADPEVLRVARRIEAGPFPATFSAESAEIHPRAEFLGPRHPLVRLAVEDMVRKADRLNRAFAIRLRHRESTAEMLPTGEYVFTIWLLDISGLRPRRELVPIFLSSDGKLCVTGDRAEEAVVQLLERAESLDPAPSLNPAALQPHREAVRAAFREIRRNREARERELESARALRRRQSLDVTLTSRVRREQRRLETLRNGGAAAFALQMAEARLEKAERTRSEALARQVETVFRVEDEEVVSGFVVVG